MGLSLLHVRQTQIVLIHVFKEYCAVLFFKGALLQDADSILVQQTENVQSARQARFTNVREIVKIEAVLKSNIYEAIEVERAGLKVKYKKTKDFRIPDEFKKKLDKMPALKTAFEASHRDGKERISFIFPRPNNPKHVRQE